MRELVVECRVKESTESSNGSGLRALIIDDQTTMRRIVRTLLKQIGITSVIEAANGEEALKLVMRAGEVSPDFIICDLHMDGMDGLEFSNRLRLSKSEDIRHIPILMLSGDTDKMMHEITAQVGVKAFMKKPVSAPELQAHIAAAVGFAV